jgi:hypothetical protein
VFDRHRRHPLALVRAEPTGIGELVWLRGMRWSSRDDFVLGRCGPLDEYSLSKDAPAWTCTSGEVYVNDMLPRYGVLAGRLDELVIERVCCFHNTRKALMPARVAGYELAKRGL